VLPDDGSWFRRSGDTAIVGCHSPDDATGSVDASTSQLECIAGKWVGPTQLCNDFSGLFDIPTASGVLATCIYCCICN